MLTVGGLFSGIGGWELGLERAGMRVLWHCEQDPFCQRVLENHWPGVPVYPDVRELRGDDVEPVDVLCGGFPCQDISIAGAGAGIDGARSGLWSEYARLIGELRPRYVFVENVSALLARGLERVLGDLAALGYDAEWDCVPASAVGAPHQRDRVWLVAYPNGAGSQGRPVSSGQCTEVSRTGNGGSLADTGRGCVQPDREPRELDGTQRRACEAPRPEGLSPAVGGGGEDVADATGERWGSSVVSRPYVVDNRSQPAHSYAGAGRNGDWWISEPDVGRVADGVPARVDRLRSLGNALVPQIAEWIGRRVLAYEQACNE